MFQPQVVPNNPAQTNATGANTTPVLEPVNFAFQPGNANVPFALNTPVMFAKNPMATYVQQHPIQQPISTSPPIPILQTTPSLNSVSSNRSVRSDSADSANLAEVAQPATPLFPQSFQPIQLVPQQTMMMNYNGQLQPLIPVVQVQTPNGPQFQPLYYLPDQFQGTPPIPIPGNQFLAPESHPIMQKQESKNRSASLSDARSVSYSHDGSEISDSYDGKTHSIQRTPLRRTSSQASNDGYGSDCGSTSRVGSDYIGDSYSDDDKKQHLDVQASDKLFYSTHPGSKASNASTYQANQDCNPATQTYAASFLMQYQANGECKQCPREISPEHPTLVEHLEKEQCRNLHKYIDRLSHTKGYQVYHSPDRGVSKKRPTSKERQEELYKTELCNYWINGQKCRFGKRCIFAHGQHELRMPKRKLERNRLRPPFRKQVVSILNKLSESNFDTLSTELLCTAVEDVRNDENLTMILAKSFFNKAVSARGHQKLYAETWRKLLNVHPMAQKLASQMQELCLKEYQKPRTKNSGINTMKWIAELCKKKTLNSQDIAHKVLGDMFVDCQKEENVELWCKLIEMLKSTVDTAKYFQQLNKMKKQISTGTRFIIMDLEDLKKRNWVPRQ